MKLRGSIAESGYRDDFIRSRNYFWNMEDGQRIVKFIESKIDCKVKSIYLLNCTPDQSTDSLTFLINGDLVAMYEELSERVPEDIRNRYPEETLEPFESISIKNYKQGLRRIGQIKLAIALELAQEDMVRKNG
jgi:hypothetical protein